jgi:uncharacterized integral membrane protein
MAQETTFGASNSGAMGKLFRKADGSGWNVRRILGVIIALAVLLLIVQNSESVKVRWAFFSFSAPQWLMMLITLIAGALIWELIKRNRRQRSPKKGAKNDTEPPAP